MERAAVMIRRLLTEQEEPSDDQPQIEPWIGVDLDGTLAHYDGFKGEDHIGEPVPAMLDRVKKWLEAGKKVKIMTARVSFPGAEGYIKDWLKEIGLPDLEITNVKDPGMEEIWDDRAIQVVKNTGEVVGGNKG